MSSPPDSYPDTGTRVHPCTASIRGKTVNQDRTSVRIASNSFHSFISFPLHFRKQELSRCDTLLLLNRLNHVPDPGIICVTADSSNCSQESMV